MSGLMLQAFHSNSLSCLRLQTSYNINKSFLFFLKGQEKKTYFQKTNMLNIRVA